MNVQLRVMSVFLNSNGNPCLVADDIRYVLLAVTEVGENIITKDNNTNIRYMGCGRQQIRMFGENVWVHVIELALKLYWYVDIAEVTYMHKQLSGYVGGMITGNGRGWLSAAEINYYNYLETYGKSFRSRINGFSYRYRIDKTVEKITQNHHMHVRLRDIYANKESVEVTGAEGVLLMYLDKYNNIEATHATFITYWRAIDDRIKDMFIAMVHINNGIDTDWLKEEGRAAKQSVYLTNAPLSQLYEINVLVNRLDIAVDWETEKDHRINPTTVNITRAQVYENAMMLFGIARKQGKKPINMEFEEFFMQRAVAMPAGAVHDEDDEINRVIKTLPREVKNKKGLASALSYKEHSYFFEKPAMINAYPSTKYEWGKTRALYGCDFTSHVHADFGLLACEETFPFFIPTGGDANEEYVSDLMKPHKQGIPVCYDYEDMNSQHSISSMQAVIEAWRDTYCHLLNDDQLRSVAWTIKSIEQQVVHDKINKTSYRAMGTMFSGWRLTSFINTALNYCYLANAHISKYAQMHIHNGDDVFITVSNLKQAIDIYVNAKSTGVRANMTKMSIGTIAEFLRVDMRARDSNSLQYLARGISTMVHSRIESGAPTTYRNLVLSYMTRYDEVGQRGGNLKALRYLYRKQLFFARKLFDVSIEVQNKMMTYDLVAGGLKKEGIVVNEKIVEVDTDLTGLTYDDIQALVHPGVKDYTTYLARKFPTFANEITKRNVFNSLLSGYNIRRKSVIVVKANQDELAHQRNMRGAWSAMSGIALINRIRMGVSNILVVMRSISADHSKALEKVNDPIEWLAILLKQK